MTMHDLVRQIRGDEHLRKTFDSEKPRTIEEIAIFAKNQGMPVDIDSLHNFRMELSDNNLDAVSAGGYLYDLMENIKDNPLN